jgi:hypothetical protein
MTTCLVYGQQYFKLMKFCVRYMSNDTTLIKIEQLFFDRMWKAFNQDATTQSLGLKTHHKYSSRTKISRYDNCITSAPIGCYKTLVMLCLMLNLIAFNK